ncbi:pentatricopeptide repeat-containing protein At3g53360, mitochondrial [Coffea eugenioides]|uniref:Pentatricopeptide repeat-containing protein At3g53360, mitochondrial n=1 Tax=Coffea arabica TaxID=13443 RepID=A0A6P6SZG9_COFAR|nr:pentatricopeptide repeat-containing protein At3g53360, mitochondrial [Coffea arabica]XP_027175165.1 pentatricopeptide repeat-containing protein At3g53360, mitochondrial [Coffea eugenioides]
MIQRLKPRLAFTCTNAKLGTLATPTPNFQNEQSSNDYISSICKQKLFKEALKAFDFIEKNTSYNVYPSTYTHLISSCASLRFLERGRKIHKHILMSNFQADMILQNHILNMYGKCGSVTDARKVFDEMAERNVVSWTSVIASYSQNDQEIEAINLYSQMLQADLLPDQYTFGSIIKACSSLSEVMLGRQLHAHVIKSEHGSHLIAQNALITMYTKFGLIIDAQDVFLRINLKDLISWSSMIAGFSQLGYELEALYCFKEMLRQSNCEPNEFVFGSVFTACGRLIQPEYGRQIHGVSIKFGFERNEYSGCAVTDMYGKCGLLGASETAFFQIEDPDVVSWNAIISGFAYGGESNKALSTFSQMRNLNLKPDDVTIRSLLCAFTSPSYVLQAKQIHSYIIKTGFDLDVPVCNTLLSIYASCSDVAEAFKIFYEIQCKADLVSWNAIISVCMQNDRAEKAFSLLNLMLLSPNKPDHITVVNVLVCCGKVTSLEMGDQTHCYACKTALKQDLAIMNGLVDMYVKCGSLENAQKLFDCIENPDVVLWSSLIVGYAQFGYGEAALKLFTRMRNSGVKPNEVTFVGVLTACSHVGLVEEGLHLFNTMEMQHRIAPTREHCSCVVDLLARAGCINEAEAFINQMAFDPDIVVWKTLLAACRTHKNIEIGKRAAENILKIDPYNSTAHVLLSSIYASTGYWKDFAALRNLMKQKGVRKVPGQSWIEVKDKIHVFSAEDGLHPERGKIYIMLEEMFLQMLDAGYVPIQR